MRTLVIGDIHGCHAELNALLREAGVRAEDRVVSVGDLVGKGPSGARVVRQFRQNDYAAVRGNHDQKLLRFRRDPTVKLSTTHQADADALDDADWEWLESLPYWLRLDAGHVVVHAGLVPSVSLDAQRPQDLMNLRAIRADGTGSSRAEDGELWATVYEGPDRVIFGHDAMRGLQLTPHAIGLDTGCVYGGELTGVWLPQRQLVSVSAERDYVGVR